MILRTMLLFGMLAAVLAPPEQAYAASVRPLELVEMTRQAETIFYGRCVSESIDATSGPVRVRVTEFEVLEWVKGDDGGDDGEDDGATYTMRQYAGPRAANVTVRLSGTQTFVPGQSYLIFAPHPSPIGLASPVGLAQGAFRVRTNPGTRALEASNGRPVAKLVERIASANLPDSIREKIRPLSTEPGYFIDLETLLGLLRHLSGGGEK